MATQNNFVIPKIYRKKNKKYSQMEVIYLEGYSEAERGV